MKVGFLKGRSLSVKLGVMLACLLVFMAVVATILGEVFGYPTQKRARIETQQTVNQYLAKQLAPHLFYENSGQATDLIKNYVDGSFVKKIMVLDSEGNLFAEYPEGLEGEVIPPPSGELSEVPVKVGSLLRFDYPIEFGEPEGTLRLWGDLGFVRSRLIRKLGYVALGNLMAIGLTLLLLPRVSRWLTKPAVHLSETADDVSEKKDYSLRATKFDDDEFGVLTDHFNTMMGTIEEQMKRSEQEHAADREALSQSLARAKRLESIGTVAGGVAHDLNNILGPMVALPDLIAQRLPPEVDAEEELGLLSTSARKAAGVIKDLLTLARRTDIELVPINLNTTVHDGLSGLGFRERMKGFPEVEIVEKLETELLPINGSDVHLSRVIFNLVLNAAESYDEKKGTVTLETKRRTLNATAHLFEEVPAGEYAVFSVTDEGHGIAPDDFERILEPFFSRKGSAARRGGSGSGLGLSVVYGVIKDHHGFMDIQSELGKGTCFSLYFPLADVDRFHDTQAVQPQQFSGEGRRALVIDDDEGQRHLAAQLFENMGFVVVLAESGENGLEVHADSTFDVVLLDMVMEPGIDGLKTLRGLLKEDPKARVILMTGYTDSDRLRTAQSLGSFPLLAKPFQWNDLSEALRVHFPQQSAGS